MSVACDVLGFSFRVQNARDLQKSGGLNGGWSSGMSEERSGVAAVGRSYERQL